MALDKVAYTLCTIQLLQNICSSLFAPFYPFEAADRNIRLLLVGIMMGTYATAFIFAAYLTGGFLKKIGRTCALRIGFLSLMGFLVIMGSVKYIEDTLLFIVLSFVGMTFGGLGTGLNSTTILAVLTSRFPEERESVMGMIEGATGIGFLLGPLIGSSLYSLGGYPAPFLTLFGLNLLLLPFLWSVSTTVENSIEGTAG